MSFVDRLLRFTIRRLMAATLHEIEFSGPVIVFAPHPDDETLGCGGTIIKMRYAAVPVKLVVMTDGRSSHTQWLTQEALKRIRSAEVLAAAAQLGVDCADVILLEFEDSQLSLHIPEAEDRVTTILREVRPACVFIPYAHDPPPDHKATHQAVSRAVQRSRQPIVCYEYPVWYWNHWPWLTFSALSQDTKKGFASQSLRAGLGLSMLRNFRYGTAVHDVLDLKRRALDQHRSQMSPLVGTADWPTLGQLADGQFLACFFQDYEIFRRVKHNE